MTDQEKALAIAVHFRRLQVTETAYKTLLSRFRLNGEPIPAETINLDVQEDLSSESPHGRALESFERALESANPSEVLGLLYGELFEPHY